MSAYTTLCKELGISGMEPKPSEAKASKMLKKLRAERESGFSAYMSQLELDSEVVSRTVQKGWEITRKGYKTYQSCEITYGNGRTTTEITILPD